MDDRADEASLKFEVRQLPEAAVVSLSGSAGIAEAGTLRLRLDELAAGVSPLIVLDLSEVDFICSQALGAIISVHTKAGSRGGKIRLVNPQPPVRKVLELTRLTKLFDIYPSVERAIKG